MSPIPWLSEPSACCGESQRPSSATFTASCLSAGPCFFLSCPIGIEDFRTWFIDLWNNSIIPYLQEGAKDGIKVSGPECAVPRVRLSYLTERAPGEGWGLLSWSVSEALGRPGCFAACTAIQQMAS